VALQPGKGKIEGKHYLPSTPETVLWGELPTTRTRPVLTVDPGATVTIDTVSQEGILEDQGRDPDAFFGRHGVTSSEVLEDARAIAASGIPHRFGVDGPHVVTGPVCVRGAEPGDVLRVEVISLLPRARYGVVANRHGHGLLAGEFPEGPPPDADADARHWQGFRTVSSFCAVERRRGKLFGALGPAGAGARVRFPLEPFLGIMAVAVDTEPAAGDGPAPGEPEPTEVAVPSTSVGLHGGALDCRDLGVGARLYLPVQVPGALFAVGDPHYAAGDGKIGLTALEGPLRATLRLTNLREPAARAMLGALREPFVETEAGWLTLGLDVDVTEAVRRAARSAVLFLASRLGLERAAALAYLSAAADFGISQLVNGVHTAYCRIRRADFTEQGPARQRLPRAVVGRLVNGGDAGDLTGEDDGDEVAFAAGLPTAGLGDGGLGDGAERDDAVSGSGGGPRGEPPPAPAPRRPAPTEAAQDRPGAR
jgi:acetamidase/formamidase